MDRAYKAGNICNGRIIACDYSEDFGGFGCLVRPWSNLSDFFNGSTKSFISVSGRVRSLEPVDEACSF